MVKHSIFKFLNYLFLILIIVIYNVLINKKFVKIRKVKPRFNWGNTRFNLYIFFMLIIKCKIKKKYYKN